MSKFTPAGEEIQKLVIDVANELDFINFGLDFEALSVPKAKDVCVVQRASKVTEYLSKRDDLILVICFEEAFDMADEATKYMWIRTAMERIVCDYEKDKVSLDAPTITIPLSVLEKYGNDVPVNAAKLSLHTISQIEDKRKQEKAEKDALKTKGKKKNF